MKQINDFLRLLIIIVIALLMLKLGFRVMFGILRMWYIVIPLILIIYLLFTGKKEKKPKKGHDDSGLDPSREVKLDDQPIVTSENEEEE
jgi:Ca2+/Na+ antiporter